MNAGSPSGSLTIARSTSSAATLPEPSQIEFSGASRYSSGIPESSTKPLPPRHSSASAACAGARLDTQYFITAVANRRNAGLGRLVVAARHPHRRDRRRLGLDRQVGEHVAHRRLLDEQCPERGAVAGVVDRLERRRGEARWSSPAGSPAACG